MDNKDSKQLINWEIEIGMITNIGVIREVFKVFAIASAIPAVFVFILWALDGFPEIIDLKDSKNFILLIFITIIGTVLLILLTGNKYPIRYEITPQGVTFITLDKRKKKNKIIALLLILLGAAKNNPTAVGTGLLASSRQNMYTNWKKVKKVIYHKKRRSISLVASDMTKNILFCNEENVKEVFNAVRLYCPKARLIEK
ncbi:hypothetical protein [Clostridium vincentii]|uniref:Uncharacterized protein n=1 Tax=Clostridium vincentii TaxID=52704 RepID=A0A2T0BIM0_9CLOT|nr:hypothetical protein [Clostridium vincentii]PRR83697.1 hypothetical protein CLVI_06440 [Clostridium vincentii]